MTIVNEIPHRLLLKHELVSTPPPPVQYSEFFLLSSRSSHQNQPQSDFKNSPLLVHSNSNSNSIPIISIRGWERKKQSPILCWFDRQFIFHCVTYSSSFQFCLSFLLFCFRSDFFPSLSSLQSYSLRFKVARKQTWDPIFSDLPYKLSTCLYLLFQRQDLIHSSIPLTQRLNLIYTHVILFHNQKAVMEGNRWGIQE